jgi:hypothetical protein
MFPVKKTFSPMPSVDYLAVKTSIILQRRRRNI